LKLEFLIKKYLSNTSDESVLTEIQNMYSKINIYDQRLNYYLFRRRIASDRIPFQIAKRIMADCKKFPKVIAVLAERSCKINANEQLKPVGEVAEKDKWFE